MAMHNPPHPGEFINEIYLAPYGVSLRRLAALLDVAPSTLTRLIRGQSGVSPEMAVRLSIALGRSPESWLAMQHNHDLWQIRKSIKLGRVRKLDVDAA
jgi:addiction module HigA family antidote